MENESQEAGHDPSLPEELIEAVRQSEVISTFSRDDFLASRKMSFELHKFLHSSDRVLAFETFENQWHLPDQLAPLMRVKTRLLRSKDASNLFRNKVLYPGRCGYILFKPHDFEPPQESMRRDLERKIEHYTAECMRNAKPSFLAYLRYLSRQCPTVVLEQAHSLILAACQNDIARLPTLTLLSNKGEPIVIPPLRIPSIGEHQWDEKQWPCQLTLANEQGNAYTMQVLSPWHLKFALIQAVTLWCHDLIKDPVKSPAEHEAFVVDEDDADTFLTRAARALGYGLVSWDQEQLAHLRRVVNTNDEPLGFWQTTVKMSDYQFDCPPVVWISQKPGRKLAVEKACIIMRDHLKAAFESGKLIPEDYVKLAKYWSKSAAQGPSSELFKIQDSSFATALVDAKSITRMVTTLQAVRKLDQERAHQWEAIDEAKFETIPSVVPRRPYQPGGFGRIPRPEAVRRMGRIRETLPISQSHYHQLICESISNNDVTILKAATGSGKTTQVPQFILDEDVEDGRNIVCTQPRRIAAISVARRVAEERGQAIGDEIGFQVRFSDQQPTAAHAINYVTAGFLLRLFEAEPQRICSQYTHIIFDEVHERDLDTDLLLTGIKNLMIHAPIRGLKVPKIVLMSATIDADMFVDFFKGTELSPKIATIEVPGKMYPVSTTYLEDYWPTLQMKYPTETRQMEHDTLMKDYLDEQLGRKKADSDAFVNKLDADPADEAVLKSTSDSANADPDIASQREEQVSSLETQKEDKFTVPTSLLACLVGDVLRQPGSGDVLVFLPGLSDIDDLANAVTDKLNSYHRLYKLHSTFGDTNFDAWEELPAGHRRIFLATNIAETSITLPHVRFVIDTGYSKQSDFDQATQTESFGRRWISKAEAAQRKGRAGRTSEGQYYATYSQKQYEGMADTQLPEMLRSSLTSIVLRTEVGAAYRRPAGSSLAKAGGVLAMAPNPPDPANIDAAVQELQRLRALTSDSKVTPMGAVLSRMPLDPAPGKTLLMAWLFRCLGPSIIATSVNPDSPLLHHPDKVADVARSRKEFAGKTYDDRLGDSAAFIAYALAELKENSEEKARLEHDSYLRQGSYTAMARHCAQIIDNIMSMMDIPRRAGRDYTTTPVLNSLFTGAMAFPNTNSSNADLIKALFIGSSGLRVARWDGRNWRNKTSTRILPSSRSVNHMSNSRQLRASNAVRRESGDLLCYLNLRTGPDMPAWASETTIIGPLGGMLFAESLRVMDDDTIVLNDWIKYKIEPQGDTPWTPAEIAGIILEYRKALDRFLAYAFSNICIAPRRLKVVESGAMKPGAFNTFFRNNVNPVRELFANSLVEIFRFDREKRTERMEARRAETEEKAPEGSKLKTFLQELKGKL